MDNIKKTCPFCFSHNILPFEQENDYKKDHTFPIIFISALVLIAGYFLFLFSVYLFFPFVVFISIIISTRFIDKKQKDKKKNIQNGEVNQYVCLTCNNSFEL